MSVLAAATSIIAILATLSWPTLQSVKCAQVGRRGARAEAVRWKDILRETGSAIKQDSLKAISNQARL